MIARGHHHEHGDDRRQRDAVEVGEAHGEQAEQRDHDGHARRRARERPAVETASRTASALAPPPRRAVAREDQQRVVDADADAEHRGDRRRPVRRGEDRGQQRDQRRRDPEPEQRQQQRQPGGDDGPERDEQHDRGDRQADRLRGDRPLLGLLDDAAAELDVRGAAQRQQPFAASRAVRSSGSVVSGRRATATAPSGRDLRPARRAPMPGERRRLRAGTPSGVPVARFLHTTSIVSGDVAGKRSESASAARLDSEPGVV